MIIVKPLVWESGMAHWARPLIGMKYVACPSEGNSWSWWLDGDEKNTRRNMPSEAQAKAAAQAHHEALILSQLQGWQPIETIPDEWKDGRDLLTWDGNDQEVLFFSQYGNGWTSGNPKIKHNPTHCMPLPTPPQATEGVA